MIVKIILAGVMGILALVCFVLSWRQFHEKGYLFNNAFIYASREEREQMDKKPYYRQSAVALLLVGLIFTLNTANVLLQTRWLFWAVLSLAAAAILYAAVSSVLIARRKAKEKENGPSSP